MEGVGEGRSAFFVAATRGHVQALLALAQATTAVAAAAEIVAKRTTDIGDKGVLDSVDGGGDTATSAAAAAGNWVAAWSLVVLAGADPNAAKRNGSAVAEAVARGQRLAAEIARADADADADNGDGDDGLVVHVVDDGNDSDGGDCGDSDGYDGDGDDGNGDGLFAEMVEERAQQALHDEHTKAFAAFVASFQGAFENSKAIGKPLSYDDW